MIDRRMMLGSGLGYAAALGGDAAMPAGAAQYPKLAVAGTFDCDARTLDAASEDFGHLVRRRPWLVFRPASAADIAAVIRWADIRRLKVAARGQGHSTYGRAMALGGIVIDMGAMNAVHLIEPDRVVVDAGATWQEVLAATLPRGLTPPVLTNYLGLSVGGTLAVGGIGGATSRHGMQTDNVLALEVVTGDGRELSCSAEHHRDLFDAVRGGLGQCGIVTRATLRLVPAPERVLRVQLFYPDLASLTADQRLVLEEGRFDQLQGAVLPDKGGWRYQLEGAVNYDGDAAPDSQGAARRIVRPPRRGGDLRSRLSGGCQRLRQAGGAAARERPMVHAASLVAELPARLQCGAGRRRDPRGTEPRRRRAFRARRLVSARHAGIENATCADAGRGRRLRLQPHPHSVHGRSGRYRSDDRPEPRAL